MLTVRMRTLSAQGPYSCSTVDDCWAIKIGRDPTTKRMTPDPIKFPDGISGVASEIHDLGLKVGIYSSMLTI